MSKEKLIKIGVEENEIVIRCKIEDLVFIAENDPEYKFKVLDKTQLAKEVVFQLQEIEPRYEAGMNIIEGAFEEAYREAAIMNDECIVDLENDYK